MSCADSSELRGVSCADSSELHGVSCADSSELRGLSCGDSPSVVAVTDLIPCFVCYTVPGESARLELETQGGHS